MKFVLLVLGVTCGSLVFEVHYLDYIFHELQYLKKYIYGSSSSNNFYIIRKLISCSTIAVIEFSIYIFLTIL